MSVRATAIADSRPALCVGPPLPLPPDADGWPSGVWGTAAVCPDPFVLANAAMAIESSAAATPLQLAIDGSGQVHNGTLSGAVIGQCITSTAVIAVGMPVTSTGIAATLLTWPTVPLTASSPSYWSTWTANPGYVLWYLPLYDTSGTVVAFAAAQFSSLSSTTSISVTPYGLTPTTSVYAYPPVIASENASAVISETHWRRQATSRRRW